MKKPSNFILRYVYAGIFFILGFIIGLLLDFLFIHFGFKHVLKITENGTELKSKNTFYFIVILQLFATFIIMSIFDMYFNGYENLFNIGLFSGQATLFKEHCKYLVESLRIKTH